MKVNSVAIVSGGLDSTTLVYDMVSRGNAPHMISFNYGQRHKKELAYATSTAQKLGLPHDVINLSGITDLISNSSLTSGRDVPEGHYAAENMKDTVVPNRNMIMLSIAAGVAVNESAVYLGIGVHSGDHEIYPDCRPKFINLMNQAVFAGNEGFGPFESYDAIYEYLYAPFLHDTKADIAYRAIELGVPFHETWSCYKGDENHCGRCGTCIERLEAIDEAQRRWNDHALTIHDDSDLSQAWTDSTIYDDSNFWKEVTA